MAAPTLTADRRVRTPPIVRVWEHQFTVYKRIWGANLVVSVIRPLMYVLGMGIGVGGLVDGAARADRVLDGLTYFQFFGPSMIATTAMMVLVNDSLWPIRGGFIWDRTFFAQAASPLTIGEIVAGVGLWQFTKGLLASAGVVGVLALFPSVRSWGLLAALVFGAVTGLAFAAPIAAWAAWRETDLSFPNINRFVIVPMFLFSGAFYPISELPTWLQWYSRATPVWHGVELCRGATFGSLTPTGALGHLLYLGLWWALGMVAARLAFASRLEN